MMILKEKKDIIRRHYIEGSPNIKSLAEMLDLQHATIRFYLNLFAVLEKERPDKIRDFDFFIRHEYIIKATPRFKKFSNVISGLVLDEEGPVLNVERLYQKYAAICPGEYSKSRFYSLFKTWFEQHEKQLTAEKLKLRFTPDELTVLQTWRKGNDHRLWQVAVALMTVYTFHSQRKLAERIDCSHSTLNVWYRIYKKAGLTGLDRPGNKKPITEEKRLAIEKKIDEVVHLVRQPPKLYGINKPSWTITDLTYVYGQITGAPLTHSTVSIYLRRRGIRFKRSREVLVSTDPQFREKLAHLQDVLSNLGPKEKFFSIDEYGPKSVRPKGGRMLVRKGEMPVYRKVDKGKGWFICTCSLELSTNQLAWFYSRKKDTEEMIKLIDVLTLNYQDQDRLYISWDAASWHNSQKLKEYLLEVNEPEYRLKLKTPEIVIVPLPVNAPHLNVIESVFSGMAKSVIHNSDYNSVEECMEAIDRYFNKRNAHFFKNPKRAGQKIWGKEKVKPVFDKANICRNIG